MTAAGLKKIEVVEERLVLMPAHIVPQNEQNHRYITSFKINK